MGRRQWPALPEGHSALSLSEHSNPCPLPLVPPALSPLQVFYYVVMALFGALKGLIQLNLGNITSFQVGGAG